jgi:hypothetical protein
VRGAALLILAASAFAGQALASGNVSSNKVEATAANSAEPVSNSTVEISLDPPVVAQPAAPASGGGGLVAIIAALLAGLIGAGLAYLFGKRQLNRLESDMLAKRASNDAKFRDHRDQINALRDQLTILGRSRPAPSEPPPTPLPVPLTGHAPEKPAPLPAWLEAAPPAALPTGDDAIADYRAMIANSALSDADFDAGLRRHGRLINLSMNAHNILITSDYMGGDPSQRLLALGIGGDQLLLLPARHFVKEFAILYKEKLEAGRIITEAFDCTVDGTGSLSLITPARARLDENGGITGLARGNLGGFVR